MSQQKMGKWIIRVVTVFLVALIAVPAFAQEVLVTGDDNCDAATGTYSVTWQVTNTESEPNRPMQITSINRTLNGIRHGTIVESGKTVVGTETIPAGFVGNISLAVSVVWEYADPDLTDAGRFTVNISGHCYKTPTATSGAPSATPEFTPTAGGTTTPPLETPTPGGSGATLTPTPGESLPTDVPPTGTPPTLTPTPGESLPTGVPPTGTPLTLTPTPGESLPTGVPPTGTPPTLTPTPGEALPTSVGPTGTAPTPTSTPGQTEPLPTDVPPTNAEPTVEGTPIDGPVPTTSPGTTPVSGGVVSFTVVGLCGVPATFTVTNTGASMTQPHGYVILSGLNQTVLATGGFQLDAGESTLVILPEGIDASDRVLFVTSDYGVMAEASLICDDTFANTPDNNIGMTAINSGITFPVCDRECPVFKVYHTDEVGGWEIFRLDSADEATRTSQRTNLSLGLDPLFKSTAPSLSPDNQWVVFSSDRDGNWELYVAPTGGGHPDAVERVTFNTVAIDSDPVWGPNNVVVYETTRHGTWDLYAMDMATGMNYRLTDGGGNDINAYWSPDGSRLLFQSDRPDLDGTRRWQVYEMSLATLQIARLSDGTTIDVDPQYSSIGDKIAFRSYAVEGGDSVIEVMSVDGTNRMALSDPAGDATNASWSPSASHVAYQSDLDGDLDIYVYEIATGQTIHLTANDMADYAPTWLCDDTRIVWTSDIMGDPNIFEVNLPQTTGESILVDPDADQMTFEVSSDVYPMSFPPEENASREGKTLLGDFGMQTSFLNPDVHLTAIDPSIDGAIRTKWRPINVCTPDTLRGG